MLTRPLRRPARFRNEPAARRGALTVEFALVAPLFFLLLISSIELARLNMLRNSVENAAYEGARSGIVPGGTAAGATTAAQRVLNAIGAVQTQVTVTPAVITTQDRQVTVTVTIPLRANLWLSAAYTRNGSLVRSCTLERERTSYTSN